MDILSAKMTFRVSKVIGNFFLFFFNFGYFFVIFKPFLV